MKSYHLNEVQKIKFITSINVEEDNIVVSSADDVIKYIPKNVANYNTLTEIMEAQICSYNDLFNKICVFGLSRSQYYFLPMLASTIFFYTAAGMVYGDFVIWATIFSLSYYATFISKGIISEREKQKFIYYRNHKDEINSILEKINVENLDMQMPMSEELIYKCENLHEKILNLDVALVDKASLNEVKKLLLYLKLFLKENIEEENKLLVRKDIKQLNSL